MCIAVGLGCGGGGDGGGTGVEPVAPVILSGPEATDIAAHRATVEWVTDRVSTSVVRYGKGVAYSESVSVSSLVTSHSVSLSGLDAVTEYHYQVSSVGEGGLGVSSGDHVIVTLCSAGDLVEEGWVLFRAGELGPALASFAEARTCDPEHVGALEGLGWTNLRLYDFAESNAALESALALEPARRDCMVALVLLSHATEDFGRAITAAQDILPILGAEYEFDHDPEIGTKDVRYCLVLSLVATGDLTGALEEAILIDGGISLDPEVPSTWGGHATFEEALLVLIEDLKTLI
jgi:hypothetical protein